MTVYFSQAFISKLVREIIKTFFNSLVQTFFSFSNLTNASISYTLFWYLSERCGPTF